MKNIVVIIGSLVREHIICEKLKEYNPVIISDFFNHKIHEICFEYIIDKPLNNENIIKNIEYLQKEYIIDYLIINQEKFIYQGLVDELKKNNIFCIAPLKNYGKIEWSKIFTRDLLNLTELSVYNPKYEYFDTYDELNIKKFINNLNENYVVKDIGLCGGKGVCVYGVHLHSIDNTLHFCKSIIDNNSSFIIEEKLIGSEFSFHSITDGINIKHMFAVQDFKRLNNNNKGPNTGSMGCISGNLNFLNNNDIELVKNINKQVLLLLKKINNDNNSYIGFLYGSFIKTIDNKIKIIEYNSRLGDPEAIPLLSLLKTDLHNIFIGIKNEKLNEIDIHFDNKYTLTRYIVPSSYCKNTTINNSELIICNNNNNNIYFGDVLYKDNKLFTNKSRTLAIINKSNDLDSLYLDNEKIIKQISCNNIHYRDDIGYNLTYKTAGVDINKYEKCISNVLIDIKSTQNNNVLKDNHPNFAGIYDLQNEECLITSNDGVGSKTLLSFKYKNILRLKNLGKDVLVNNLNDCLCVSRNINPITFIDYLSMNNINKDFETVIQGICEECNKYNISLIGGETSEMNIYKQDENMEIVGFINCLSNKKDLFNINDVVKNNVILGFKTNNFATNGFSLIRKVLDSCDDSDIDLFIDEILSPHKCYFNQMKILFNNNIKINACAHITGGGIFSNINRVVPDNLNYKINQNIILDNLPKCMNFIKIKGNLSEETMFDTFNMGIGFCIIIDKKNKDDIFNLFENEILELGYII